MSGNMGEENEVRHAAKVSSQIQTYVETTIFIMLFFVI